MIKFYRSVFNRSIRTNNDTEGWHRRLNAKAARGQLDLYLLLQLLKDEALLAQIQLDLLKESYVTRVQRSHHTTKRLFILWDEFAAGEKTARQLLRAASRMAPVF